MWHFLRETWMTLKKEMHKKLLWMKFQYRANFPTQILFSFTGLFMKITNFIWFKNTWQEETFFKNYFKLRKQNSQKMLFSTIWSKLLKHSNICTNSILYTEILNQKIYLFSGALLNLQTLDAPTFLIKKEKHFAAPLIIFLLKWLKVKNKDFRLMSGPLEYSPMNF